MTPPAITVLMPVYNGERYLRAAIESVLGQGFGDFELLVIDDGSTDDTPRILAACTDPRLRVSRTENRGVARALAHGVELARGRYIARMDADDECLPGRLAAQAAVLESDADVVLVHGAADLVDADGVVTRSGVGNRWSDAQVKWLLVWQNAVFHPTVMLRTSTLRAHGLNYRADREGVEDLDLWNQLAPHGRFAYVDRAVLRYRRHTASVTGRSVDDRQVVPYAEIVAANLARLGEPVSAETAREFAVISGATGVDPLAVEYLGLARGGLAVYARAEAAYCRSHRVRQIELGPVQDVLLLKWSRFMLGTSRRQSLALLAAAVRRRRGLCLRRRAWQIALAACLPRSMLRRFGATGRAGVEQPGT